MHGEKLGRLVHDARFIDVEVKKLESNSVIGGRVRALVKPVLIVDPPKR